MSPGPAPGGCHRPLRRRIRIDWSYENGQALAAPSFFELAQQSAHEPGLFTIENISGNGARVMTALDLGVGDRVRIADAEGLIEARGEVRGIHEGKDGIRRLSVRFID